PLAYLAAVLDQALRIDEVVPPYPARAHAEYRRELAREQRDAAAASLGATLAELDTRDPAAAASTGAGLAAFRAARAQLPAPGTPLARRAWSGHAPPPHAANDAGPEQAWPAVAQPGAGPPASWSPGTGRDRAADPDCADRSDA